MAERQKSRNLSPVRPRWFWAAAGAFSLAVVVVFFSDPTLTVQADTPLARPASTLAPAAPPASLLRAQPAPAAKPSVASQALKGVASWYGCVLNGHYTASGERFDEMAMTAAHNTLPFGTMVRVVDLKTKKSVVVRVNDRGDLPDNRVIDLSYGAAKELGIVRSGLARVHLEVISVGHSGARKP